MYHRSTITAGLFAACILTLGLLAFPLPALASQVTLEWDPVTPTPEGYKLFQRLESQSYDYNAPIYTGDATTYTVTGLEPGQVYYFVVRAFDNGCESDDSNEVSFTPSNSSSGEDSNTSGGDATGTEQSGEEGDAGNQDHSGTETGGGDSDSGNPGTVIVEPDNNTAPYSPVVVAPDQVEDVSLTPQLVAGEFFDPDGDGHTKSRWQVSTTADFSNLVLDRVCFNQLTEFSLADTLLDTETTYYWRVCYTDSAGMTSAWSQAGVFVTRDNVAAGDADGDGLPDSQEVDSAVDLDGDGQPDSSQSNILVVKTALGDGFVAVKCNSPDVQVVALKSLVPEEVAGQDTPPGDMTFGLISFKLLLEQDVSTATITVYFSEKLDPEARWYKYSTEDGWQAYEYAMFGSDGHSVTLVLEDGGMGDEDGVRNGIIVDPSGMGLGYGQGVDSAEFSVPGCFIGVGMHSNPQRLPVGWSKVLVAVSLLLAMALVSGLRKREKLASELVKSLDPEKLPEDENRF